MNLNLFNFLYKIQDAGAEISDTLQSATPTEQISLWQLVWGYDSASQEYSLTSLIVMSLLFIFSIVAIYVFIERVFIENCLISRWNLRNKLLYYRRGHTRVEASVGIK